MNSVIAILEAINIKPFKTSRAINAGIPLIGPNISMFVNISSDALKRGIISKLKILIANAIDRTKNCFPKIVLNHNSNLEPESFIPFAKTTGLMRINAINSKSLFDSINIIPKNEDNITATNNVPNII
jgi:hypothetical protein